jgi:excisionase family DNA binding protein
MSESIEPLTYSVETVAGLLGISRGLCYELVRRGEIPVLRLGRRLVISRVAFERWLETGSLCDGSIDQG